MTVAEPTAPAPRLAALAEGILRVARLLLENGAESRRVFETTQHLGKQLGLNELHVLVTHRSIMVTAVRDEEIVTRIMRVNTLVVNFTMVSGISRMLKRFPEQGLSLETLQSELDRLTALKPHYPRPLVIASVGLACGAFSLIFEGDLAAFVSASAAAALGLFVRQEMHHRAFQPLLCIFSAAVVASVSAHHAAHLLGSAKPEAALVASTLMLVPGVPMINAVADLMKGHLLTGMARALTVALMALSVALGLLAGMVLGGFNNY